MKKMQNNVIAATRLHELNCPLSNAEKCEICELPTFHVGEQIHRIHTVERILWTPHTGHTLESVRSPATSLRAF